MKHKLNVVSNGVYKSDANRLSEPSAKVVSDALHWPQSCVSIENETQTYALSLVLILNVCHSINLRGAVKIKYTPSELIITPHSDLRHIRLGYLTFLPHITHIPHTHTHTRTYKLLDFFFYLPVGEREYCEPLATLCCYIVSFVRFTHKHSIHSRTKWLKNEEKRMLFDSIWIAIACHISVRIFPLLFR